MGPSQGPAACRNHTHWGSFCVDQSFSESSMNLQIAGELLEAASSRPSPSSKMAIACEMEYCYLQCLRSISVQSLAT